MLASFSLIWSSILAIRELHLRWIGATLCPFFFLGLLKYHFLNFHAEEHLPILWKSVYRFPETHQEVVYRVPVLTSVAHCIRSSFFLSVSIISSSNGRFPLLGLGLRWADDRDVSDGADVCTELSAEEHSATKSSSVLVQLSFSGSVDCRSSCLDSNCMLLSIFVAFEVLTYSLHGAESVLRSELVLQLVKKFPALYGTRKFITVFTSARHLSLSRANSIQSPPPPTSRRSILIFPSTSGSPQWSLSLRFPH